MIRLALLIFTIAATTLMGMFVIATLSMGYYDLIAIIAAAAAGFALAVPVSYVVARMIARR
ncbi:CTP synthetase [Rhodobacteraceae bacterium WD3A24]|nr:CTP synthetase [Rhodobacteraceae bacterium WD3A24]